MGTINTTGRGAMPHQNKMGGPSYDVNPILRLRMAAASCFFGEPQYYATGAGKKPAKYATPPRQEHLRATLGAVTPKEWAGLASDVLIEQAIDAALDADAQETLRFAVELRRTLNIRTTPQVIMVRAARHPKVRGTHLLREYGDMITQRLDEVCVQMAYHLDKFGKPIPNGLKRAWARRIAQAKPYELAKYRMENRKVALRDVINVCHPASDAVSAFMKGEVKQTEKNATWESVRSEAGKVEGADATMAWTEASKKMGHMALLRNLRNLEQNRALTDDLLKQLVEGAATGKQLPFRYYAAYQAMGSGGRGQIQDAIDEAMQASMGNLPEFKGRVMSLVDNSGSARGARTSSLGTMRVCDIGNLMGLITAKRADDGYVGVFGDRLQSLPVRKKSSIFDDLKTVDKLGVGIGGGTEHGIWLFWDQAICNAEHWDHVFVYSDMQAGHGGLYGTGRDMKACPMWPGGYIDVPSLIHQYRAKVNPNVQVYLVQIAGHQDTLIPEYYDKTYILGGWSEEILRFAAYMQQAQA